jgi:hypothetical protein
MIEERAKKAGQSLVLSVPGGLKESLFIPGSTPWSFGCHSSRGSAHDTWDEHLVAVANVLGNLDAQHLSWAHLFVEEFDDTNEFGRKEIRHEHHADMAAFQIGRHALPELIYLNARSQFSQTLATGTAIGNRRRFESGSEVRWWPVAHTVGGVVQHLANDFPTNACVG